MAIVFDMDEDEDLLRASTHGMLDSDDVRFFRDRLDTAMRLAGSSANDYLRSAYDSLKNFDLGRLRDRVDGLRDRFNKRWDEDRLFRLKTIRDAQNSKPVQRRYLMSIPRLRALYQAGRSDGFGDLYHDEEPGAIGRNHTPYREVWNGSYVENDEGEDRFVQYLGVEDEDGEQPLNHRSRVDGRANEEFINELLDQGGQDPASVKCKTL